MDDTKKIDESSPIFASIHEKPNISEQNIISLDKELDETKKELEGTKQKLKDLEQKLEKAEQCRRNIT